MEDQSTKSEVEVPENEVTAPLFKVRKSQVVNAEAIELRTTITKELDKLKEMEELERLAKQQEADIIKDAMDRIQAIADEVNCFCGVRLNRQDVLSLIGTALENPTAMMQMPFSLYYIT